MKDNPIFEDDLDEKPKGSPGYWIALVLIALAFALGVALLPSALAHAQEPEPSEASQHPLQEIERTTAEYEKAAKQLDEANKAVKQNEQRIKQLKKDIPAQRERCRKATREQYKMQQNSSGVVEFLLSADDFYAFSAGVDYITRASEANIAEMTHLVDLKDELDKRENDLAKAQAEAQTREQEADAALKATQQARRDAQSIGQQNARNQAAQEEAEALALREAAAERARAEAEEKARAEQAAQQAFDSETNDIEESGDAEQPSADAADAQEDSEEEQPDEQSSEEAAPAEPAEETETPEAPSPSTDEPTQASDASEGGSSAAATPTEDDLAIDEEEPKPSDQAQAPEESQGEADNDDELLLSGREPTLDELDRPNAREGEDPAPPKGLSFTPPVDDGADWGQDEETFVNEWAGRIDAYLAGSALDGQGKTFAHAAWVYGIDPRWSPAISNTESSKGGICFLPYNAWGWGQSSWSSWEEAIDAHVAALASSYGYTISIGAAKTYCPPNWEFWYKATVEQMNAI